ncbi:MAG: aminomethyl transferase family protein [Gemmatimonadales bacterium]|nr:MAG: aminomethyl transferase family protein [Gemmatimonadales bacterium]
MVPGHRPGGGGRRPDPAACGSAQMEGRIMTGLADTDAFPLTAIPAPLQDVHREEGARMAETPWGTVPRHYGDTTAEYRAATGEAALVDRSNRVLVRLEGRAPGRMLTGVVSGRMPPAPTPGDDGVGRGRAFYSTILTPKGRIVTDLRLFRLEGGDEGAHLLDVPAAGWEPLQEHFQRYLPPRFARVVEPSPATGMITVVGSAAAHLLAGAFPEFSGLVGELEALEEGEERVLSPGGLASRGGSGAPDDGMSLGAIHIVRSGEVQPLALDVVGPADALADIWRRLRERGVPPAGHAVWETLRIEHGRPAFGVELLPETLLPEAGVVARAVDQTKGCYTGQEVIVRIRDRGKVNRHLRGFLLGDAPAPAAGTPLFIEGRSRDAGEIRSAVESPRFGQGIALGYLRREAEPPGTARLGAPDGPEIAVRALSDDGWILAEDDPDHHD